MSLFSLLFVLRTDRASTRSLFLMKELPTTSFKVEQVAVSGQLISVKSKFISCWIMPKQFITRSFYNSQINTA